MKILLDINIWIDIAARPTTYPQSIELLHSLETSHHSIGFPLSGYTTFYYLIAKLISKQGALHFAGLLSQRGIHMLPFTSEEAILAQSLPFRDHEDACVGAIALLQKYNVIATRNVKDFRNSPVVARSPAAILRSL